MNKVLSSFMLAAFLMGSSSFAVAQQKSQDTPKSTPGTIDVVKKNPTPVFGKGHEDKDIYATWLKAQQEALDDRYLWEPGP